VRSPETDSHSTDLQSIHPLSLLDPAEVYQREEVPARDRGGLQLQRQPGSGWRKLTHAELAAVVAMPALIVLGILLGTSGAPPAVVVSSIGVLICGLAAFAVSGRRPGV
jgi:hypothetical protein